MLAIWARTSLAKTRVACTCEYCSKFQASYLHSSKCGGKFVSMFPTIYWGCALLGDSKQFTVHRSNLWLCELNYLSCVFTLYNKDVIMWQKLSSHFLCARVLWRGPLGLQNSYRLYNRDPSFFYPFLFVHFFESKEWVCDAVSYEFKRHYCSNIFKAHILTVVW